MHGGRRHSYIFIRLHFICEITNPQTTDMHTHTPMARRIIPITSSKGPMPSITKTRKKAKGQMRRKAIKPHVVRRTQRVSLLFAAYMLATYFLILLRGSPTGNMRAMNFKSADHAGEHQEDDEMQQCKCMNCEEDKTCGGLWKANRYDGSDDLATKKIHIVVSHCKSGLDWIPQYVKGYNVESIHVISKCGKTVNGAPEMATIEVLPNVGRCDHTYAYYINKVLDKKVKKNEEKDSIVVFLKDDVSRKNMHQGGVWNNFGSLLKLASSDNGFGCGVIPGYRWFEGKLLFLSAYHEVKTLFTFSMAEYERNIKGYASDKTDFKSSDFKSLGSWYTSLKAGSSPPVVQVCYGGVFSASVANIMKRDKAVWSAVEKSLSRGNNIQEGHYAERSWAHLLSTPLQPFQVRSLLTKSNGVFNGDPTSAVGPLQVRVKGPKKKFKSQLYL